ncbi:hypothetical protein ACIPEN_02300 [Herbaspirillum chlorophenolicum]|uniref:Uncharacterized protein n=1 Tax=Herbaspirillum chlorophenolicum TaxID=211589 RepID=A0ABW8ET51_9BURK|nr:hypothetical protein [Herbaspirillum chlorophenolicum]
MNASIKGSSNNLPLEQPPVVPLPPRANSNLRQHQPLKNQAQMFNDVENTLQETLESFKARSGTRVLHHLKHALQDRPRVVVPRQPQSQSQKPGANAKRGGAASRGNEAQREKSERSEPVQALDKAVLNEVFGVNGDLVAENLSILFAGLGQSRHKDRETRERLQEKLLQEQELVLHAVNLLLQTRERVKDSPSEDRVKDMKVANATGQIMGEIFGTRFSRIREELAQDPDMPPVQIIDAEKAPVNLREIRYVIGANRDILVDVFLSTLTIARSVARNFPGFVNDALDVLSSHMVGSILMRKEMREHPERSMGLYAQSMDDGKGFKLVRSAFKISDDMINKLTRIQ